MEFKKIAKCTGKALAKTALFTGGLACDLIPAMAENMAAKQNGEKSTRKAEKGSNCCSRWLYEKAENIHIKE